VFSIDEGLPLVTLGHDQVMTRTTQQHIWKDLCAEASFLLLVDILQRNPIEKRVSHVSAPAIAYSNMARIS
jgi:hypothetical protein